MENITTDHKIFRAAIWIFLVLSGCATTPEQPTVFPTVPAGAPEIIRPGFRVLVCGIHEPGIYHAFDFAYGVPDVTPFMWGFLYREPGREHYVTTPDTTIIVRDPLRQRHVLDMVFMTGATDPLSPVRFIIIQTR